jgi:hypothetical protein
MLFVSCILTNVKCVQVKSIGIYNFVQVVSSLSGSSSVSERSSSDAESLQDVPLRSTSDTDLPSATDSVFNISHHSERESLEQVSSVLETEFVESRSCAKST